MNKQKAPNGIEWTRIRRTIADGTEETLTGWTWNPTGGCLHGCTWQMPDGSITECYAKTIAERFTTAYEQGFESHYWRPHTLQEPLRLKTPSGIFVGSMADLFGHWVAKEQIRQVLDVMTQAHWHTFQTLSKYPIRLPEFNPFPENVWVGVSIPAGRLMNPKGAANALFSYLKHMEKVEANIRFMSVEPLWFDVTPVFEKWLQANDRLPFEWIIIGAASNGRKLYQPKPEWTQSLLDLLDAQNIPVFFKGNMDWSLADWRDAFPTYHNIEVALA
jgi:protein gp37